MRIALVESTRFPPREGLGNYVWHLAKYLSSRGHTPEIFTRGENARSRSFEEEGIPVHAIVAPPLHPLHVQVHGFFLQRAFDRSGKFDVVHMHSPLPPALRTKAPTLLTFHTPVQADTEAISTWNRTSVLYRLQTPFSVRIEKKLINRATRISAVSQSVAKDLERYGVASDRVIVIGNGVDTSRFEPSANDRGQFLLYTGRLGPRKGLNELVDMLAHLKNAGLRKRLVITGEGPFRNEIRERARRRQVEEQIDFVGFVDRPHLISLLQRASIFVFSSHYEGLPTSVLEAMSTGAPIVASSAPGVIDLIRHGENGILVPVGDSIALARAVQQLDQDESLRKRLGAQARLDASKTYSWQAIGHRIEKIYGSLVKP